MTNTTKSHFNKLRRFYILVIIFSGFDMVFNIALLWHGFQVTKTPVVIGTILTISVLIPFFISRLLAKKNSLRLDIKKLVYVRLICFSLILVSTFFSAWSYLAGIILIAFIIGVCNYLTISTLESINTQLVITKLIDSNKASRWMQTSIQIGAFSGSLIAGILLDYTNINTMSYIVSFLGLVCLFFSKNLTYLDLSKMNTNEIHENEREGDLKLDGVIITLYLSLSFVGFHIAAFNSMIPIVFQELNEWSASYFGIASGLAGIGALTAALIKFSEKQRYLVLLTIIIILADIFIVYTNTFIVIPFTAIALGFCINTVRIAIRQLLIEKATDSTSADIIAQQSSVSYLLASSLAPMILTLLIMPDFFGIEASRMMLVSSAIFLLLFVLLNRFIQKKNDACNAMEIENA